ncbi:hypothetical protein ACFWBX_20255 [Streptomyces sp. NPDC059991]|uniref:hypothetical protein n=1 Tax=Streptomyces sp. NPDC059991 TaxID=3347028 RepID=UPI0036881231
MVDQAAEESSARPPKPRAAKKATAQPTSLDTTTDLNGAKVPAEWRGLAWLSKECPDVYRELLAQKTKDQVNARRLAWGPIVVQIIGSLSGLAALAGLVLLSWHMSDRNQGPEAAAVVTTGAVSIVAVFVTGKVANARSASRTSSRSTRATQ